MFADDLFSEVFPKWSTTFIEVSDFRKSRESDELLKHELGSI